MDSIKLKALAGVAEAVSICLSEIAAISNHFWGIALPHNGDAASMSDACAAGAAFALIERETRRMQIVIDNLAFDIKELKEDEGNE